MLGSPVKTPNVKRMEGIGIPGDVSPSFALWRVTSPPYPPYPPTSLARPTTLRSTAASCASKWLEPSSASPL
eukprot:5771707-Prymnesium_polylepis.1